MVEDFYIFPKYFYIKKAEKMISKSLLEKVMFDTSSYLLINEKNEDIFIIDVSVKGFLEAFRKSNCLVNVAKKIKDGMLPYGEIHNSFQEIFSQMRHNRILVPINEMEETDNISIENLHLSNLDIIQVLKKNQIAMTAIALDKERNEKVVIKFLSSCMDEEAIQIFQHEFYIMNKIGSHPLIRSLISFDKNKNIAILEYIKGRTLEELVIIGKLKIKHKLFLAYKVIESLSVLHEKAIIHGDIHINQFLVDVNFNVKLIDFGNSIIYSEKNTKNMKGGVCHCLEPEIIMDNAFVICKSYTPDFRKDIYRLGVLIYFLIYEKYPFDSFSWKQLYRLIRTEEPELNSYIKDETIPFFVIAILKKSLTKDSKKRFQSASELLAFFDKEYEKYNGITQMRIPAKLTPIPGETDPSDFPKGKPKVILF